MDVVQRAYSVHLGCVAAGWCSKTGVFRRAGGFSSEISKTRGFSSGPLPLASKNTKTPNQIVRGLSHKPPTVAGSESAVALEAAPYSSVKVCRPFRPAGFVAAASKTKRTEHFTTGQCPLDNNKPTPLTLDGQSCGGVGLCSCSKRVRVARTYLFVGCGVATKCRLTQRQTIVKFISLNAG